MTGTDSAYLAHDPEGRAGYGGEAKRLLEDLQSRNERMFLVTVLFLNTAKTRQALDNAVFQAAGIAQKYNCSLRRLDYMQEPGLMISLPLGLNLIPIKRALTTTSTAIFVPFTTQELFMGGESLYVFRYGSYRSTMRTGNTCGVRR